MNAASLAWTLSWGLSRRRIFSSACKEKMPKCRNDPTRSYRGDEPSPKGLGFCAHAVKVGTRKRGEDKKWWVVKEYVMKSGTRVKTWKPAPRRRSSSVKTWKPAPRRRASSATRAKPAPRPARLDRLGRWRVNPWGRWPPRHTKSDIAELRKIVGAIDDKALRVILQGPATWEEAGELVRLGAARKHPHRYLPGVKEVFFKLSLVA